MGGVTNVSFGLPLETDHWSSLSCQAFARSGGNAEELPDPAQFAVAAEATFLSADPPTNEEVREGMALEKSSQWAQYVSRLMGWMGQHPAASLTGRDHAGAFRKWRASIEKFFQIWGINNTTIQAKLATITLQEKADLWWKAHCRARPGLIVSYAQLTECLGQETSAFVIPGGLAVRVASAEIYRRC